MAKLELFSLIENLDLMKQQFLRKAYQVKSLEVVENEEDNILLKNIAEFGKLYFNVEFSDKELKSFAVLYDGKVYLSESKELFEKLLCDEKIEKYTRNSKSIFAYADRKGFEIKSLVFDVELAAYLLEPSSKDYSDENLCKLNEIELPATENEEYKIYRALAVYDLLCEKLNSEIKANEQEKLLVDIEIPLADVLAKMENIFDADRQEEDYGKC